MKKGRHRRFEEARALKQAFDLGVEPGSTIMEAPFDPDADIFTVKQAAGADWSDLNLVLWLSALSGPVSWAVHLMLMYPGVEIACRFRTEVPLYALSAFLFGTAALGALVNWRYLRYMQGLNGATTSRRVRFMATAGLLGAILFMILIIAGTLPVLFDDPCQLQGRRRPTLIPYL